MNLINKRASWITVLVIAISMHTSQAQNNKPENKNSKWSVEYSAAGALVRIHAVHGLYKIADHSELIVGPCFQNYKNNQGRAHAYTLLLGYRHTFWKNVVIDYELFPAYNEFKSSIDGELHTGFELYSELRPGYKFNFKMGDCKAYVLPQLTIGYGLWTNNKWPDFDKQPNPAIMANFWFGIQF